jgi:hypothetical protein
VALKALKNCVILAVETAMKAALYFFAPFLVLPLLWVYFSYIHPTPRPKVAVLRPPEQEIKAATPEDPGPIATVVSPVKTLQQSAQPAGDETRLPAASAMSPLDHADAIAIPPSQHFLHQRFDLKDQRDFVFVVPAHMVNPKLQGTYQAFMNPEPGATNLSAVEIDFALMDDRQFDDFVHARRADAIYEKPAASQTISFAIPPTHEQDRRYHLVFMTESPRPAVVDGDFTLSFQ